MNADDILGWRHDPHNVEEELHLLRQRVRYLEQALRPFVEFYQGHGAPAIAHDIWEEAERQLHWRKKISK